MNKNKGGGNVQAQSKTVVRVDFSTVRSDNNKNHDGYRVKAVETPIPHAAVLLAELADESVDIIVSSEDVVDAVLLREMARVTKRSSRDVLYPLPYLRIAGKSPDELVHLVAYFPADAALLHHKPENTRLAKWAFSCGFQYRQMS